MATEVQDPLGEAAGIAPAPAAPKPGIPDYLAGNSMLPVAQGIVSGAVAPAPAGTSADLARTAAQLMPIPDPQKYRDAEANYADKVQEYSKLGTDYKESYQAKADEVEIAAKQYEQRARELLPQTTGVQPAPPRSLRGFLAPTENEDPYTTVSKFMQSVSLLATMMGGGRNGARESVSALTGAVEGWTKGDRYRADSEYQTWKDTTEALFRQFDDEMRRYNSIMIAERVPLEQKLRALETSAWLQKNAMAQKAFEVGQAREAFEQLDKMRQAGVKAQLDAATIIGQRADAEQRQAQFEARMNQTIDALNKQLEAKYAGLNVQLEVAKLGSDTRRDIAELKAALGAQGGKPSDRQMKVVSEGKNTETVLGKLDELMTSGKVDLNKIVGGVKPWFNQMSQKWGGNSPTPPEGADALPIDRGLIKGRLTTEEQQFLALLKDYGDSLMRQRSGKAISGYEFDNFLQFGLDPSLSPATIRSRMALAREKNVALLANEINTMKLFGIRSPELSDVLQASRIGGGQPTASAPAPGSKREGNEWVSESGKYVWRGGQWVAR